VKRDGHAGVQRKNRRKYINPEVRAMTVSWPFFVAIGLENHLFVGVFCLFVYFILLFSIAVLLLHRKLKIE
jgi:hypothetical protein